MANVRRLTELGMVPPLAKEVASQITAGVGNARRLAELSMVPVLAKELADQITAKVGNVRRLAELTMVPGLANEVADQIQDGGVPPWVPAGKFDAEWDPRDISTLFQDTARTIPVTATGQSVAGVTDKQGSRHLSNVVPPVYTLVEGRGAISLNGTTQYMQCDAIATLLTGTNKPFTIAWVEVDDDGGPSGNQHRWFGGNTATTNSRLAVIGDASGAEQFLKRGDADAQNLTSLNGGIEGSLEYWVLRHNGTTLDAWLNGDRVVNGAPSSNTLQTLTHFMIGARKLGGGAIDGFWNGKLCWMAIKAEAFSDTEIASLNGWLQSAFPVYFPTGTVDLFLSAGQSNERGAGNKDTSPNVPAGDGWMLIGNSFYPLKDPVGGAATGSKHPAFANRWKQLTGRTAVFVPTALGGTSVNPANNQWNPTGSLHVSACAAMNAAAARLAAIPGVTLGGKYVTWSEGETYAGFINDGLRTAADYNTALTNSFNAFFSNIPGLSKIFVWQTGTRASQQAAHTAVQNEQIAVTDALANVDMVSLRAKFFLEEGLQSDGIHWDQPALNEQGTLGATNAVAAL